MAPKLSVNVNAIAHLRNRRDLPWPSVVGIGRIALEAGAHGLTVHPRPDERHIRKADVPELVAMIRKDFPGREFNIEGYPAPAFLALVEAAMPDQVTLVPDDPSQGTSDHGWDIARNRQMLADVTARLKAKGMRVSLFVDADPAVAPLAKAVGADRIELYTGPFGGGLTPAARAANLAKLRATAEAARAAGLGVNAGHDLTRENLPELVSNIPYLAEVSIGHAVIGDALIFGMAETVRKFRAACGNSITN
jgi:pyridoxine 5-phosphate synthase